MFAHFTLVSSVINLIYSEELVLLQNYRLNLINSLFKVFFEKFNEFKTFKEHTNGHPEPIQ